MLLLSVNVGLPREVAWQGRRVRTGIFKAPVAGPVPVGKRGLAGDGQADLRVHGGSDKAVYAYAHEHYAYWEPLLPDAALCGPGLFGENLTTVGLLEPQVRVGDEFIIGEARLQAIQPRFPCYKLGLRLGDPRFVPQFMAAGRSGIYFRVLQEGIIQAGDSISLAQPSAYDISLQDVADLYHGVRQDRAAVRALVEIPCLPEQLKAQFLRLLAA